MSRPSLPSLLAVIASLLMMGCATVSVEGQRRPNDPPLVEPITFIIFKSSTPPGHSEALRDSLAGELNRLGIASRFTIVTNLGVAKGGVVAEAVAEVPSFVLLAPSNGTPNINGVKHPESYDVRAYRIIEHPGPAEPGSGPDGTTPINDGKGRADVIWRGRVYASGGFRPNELPTVAARLVEKLVADHVLWVIAPAGVTAH